MARFLGVEDKTYWSSGEVGKFFGQSAQAAIRWGDDPDNTFPAPFRNPSGQRRWDPDEVKAWAEANGWPTRDDVV